MDYLSERIDGDILVLEFQVAALVDLIAIDAVAKEWHDRLSRSELMKVVVDFGPVAFVSSSLLGNLVSFRTHCLARGITLRICGLSEDFSKVMSMTRLDGLFSISHSQQAAIEQFASDSFLVRQQFFSQYDAAMESDMNLGVAVPVNNMSLTPTESPQAYQRMDKF